MLDLRETGFKAVETTNSMQNWALTSLGRLVATSIVDWVRGEIVFTASTISTTSLLVRLLKLVILSWLCDWIIEKHGPSSVLNVGDQGTAWSKEGRRRSKAMNGSFPLKLFRTLFHWLSKEFPVLNSKGSG